ncbi:hypothetical protein niasHT_007707 [Heterodera trifolii]|uniref:Uncharacterized protein n=1 Tax=Heterodera trifolii TaxID=157864 RepID=A0ABD2MA88_9BILA
MGFGSEELIRPRTTLAALDDADPGARDAPNNENWRVSPKRGDLPLGRLRNSKTKQQIYLPKEKKSAIRVNRSAEGEIGGQKSGHRKQKRKKEVEEKWGKAGGAVIK